MILFIITKLFEFFQNATVMQTFNDEVVIQFNDNTNND
jgi:hypothetical protein